jgi:ubiquitin C-terminal hydrolase
MYEEEDEIPADVVQPLTFRNTIIRCVDQFRGNRQQDAHECLLFILQLLHEGLGQPVAIEIASKEPNRNPTMAWGNFVKHEKKSNILEWFYGQYETTKKCLQCNTVFPTYDALNCLSLEIPTKDMKQEFSLDDLLKTHVATEKLSDKYTCEVCESPQEAETKHMLWKCPSVLIVQLKRFGPLGGKIESSIEYPFELDLRNYVSQGNQGQSTVYDLYAVVYHQGQLNGGHYYVSCKVDKDEWWIFNDHENRQVQKERVVSQFAYILFYKKRFGNGESLPPKWDAWWYDQ